MPRIHLFSSLRHESQRGEISRVGEHVDSRVNPCASEATPTHSEHAAGGVASAAKGVAREQRRDAARATVDVRDHHLERESQPDRRDVQVSARAGPAR